MVWWTGKGRVCREVGGVSAFCGGSRHKGRGAQRKDPVSREKEKKNRKAGQGWIGDGPYTRKGELGEPGAGEVTSHH